MEKQRLKGGKPIEEKPDHSEIGFLKLLTLPREERKAITAQRKKERNALREDRKMAREEKKRLADVSAYYKKAEKRERSGKLDKAETLYRRAAEKYMLKEDGAGTTQSYYKKHKNERKVNPGFYSAYDGMLRVVQKKGDPLLLAIMYEEIGELDKAGESYVLLSQQLFQERNRPGALDAAINAHATFSTSGNGEGTAYAGGILNNLGVGFYEQAKKAVQSKDNKTAVSNFVRAYKAFQTAGNTEGTEKVERRYPKVKDYLKQQEQLAEQTRAAEREALEKKKRS
ncbi:MAG: hypothetical protein V1921_00115 [Candidatus Altiarchaeota archaeon]